MSGSRMRALVVFGCLLPGLCFVARPACGGGTTNSENAGAEIAGCGAGRNCYIRAGASGKGDGSSWSDAYTGFGRSRGQVDPARMRRGATYWIAAGDYGSVPFSTPNDRGMPITLKGATHASHGPAVDWQNNYVGQAVFSECSITSDDWIVDGQQRGADWRSGYSLKFWNRRNPHGAGITLGTHEGGVHRVALQYIEVEGTGEGFPNNATADKCNVDNCGKWADFALYEAQPSGNIEVRSSYLHHTGNTQFQMNAAGPGGSINHDLLWEYNWISYNHTGQNGQHDEAYSLLANNVTIRYNVFQDISGSGIITDASANQPALSDWFVYGNIFFNDATYLALGQVYWLNTVDQGIVVLGDGSGGAHSEKLTGTFVFANNTIANFNPPGVDCRGTYSTLPMAATTMIYGSARAVIQNNLWYRSACVFGNYNPLCKQLSGGCVQDYNASYAGGLGKDLNWMTGEFPAAHDVNIAGSRSPFRNSAPATLEALQLAVPDPFLSHAGVVLSAPYERDMWGVARGANGVWDRGALQLEGNSGAALGAASRAAPR